MWRSGGDVIIQLEAKIGGENVVGWKYTVGRLKDCGMDYTTHPKYPTKTWVFNASWSKTESAGEYTKELFAEDYTCLMEYGVTEFEIERAFKFFSMGLAFGKEVAE